MKIQQYVRNSLIFAISSNYDTVWRDLNSKLKDENCNFLQAVILISIFFEQNGSVTPSDLAEIFRTTRGNVSHCVSHLEKRGFLKRMLDEDDARSYRLILKPEGKKVALRLIKIIDDLENHFERHLGKQGVQGALDNMSAIETTYRKQVTKTKSFPKNPNFHQRIE